MASVHDADPLAKKSFKSPEGTYNLLGEHSCMSPVHHSVSAQWKNLRLSLCIARFRGEDLNSRPQHTTLFSAFAHSYFAFDYDKRGVKVSS